MHNNFDSLKPLSVFAIFFTEKGEEPFIRERGGGIY